MLQDEILDFHPVKKGKAFRWPIILLEFLPLISILIVRIIKNEPFVLLFGFPIMSLIYLLFGWTIFKGQKYERVEVIVAEVTSLYLIVCSVAILFLVEMWEPNMELTYFSLFSGVLIDLYLIRHYLINRTKALQYRFSIKLLSRVLIFQIVLILVLERV